MKIGDQFMVSMEGFNVCFATVEVIDGDEVTIRIPETRVVMGIKHSLADLDTDRPEQILEAAQKETFVPPEKDYEDSADKQILSNETTVVSGGIKEEDISDVGLRGMALDSSAID